MSANQHQDRNERSARWRTQKNVKAKTNGKPPKVQPDAPWLQQFRSVLQQDPDSHQETVNLGPAPSTSGFYSTFLEEEGEMKRKERARLTAAAGGTSRTGLKEEFIAYLDAEFYPVINPCLIFNRQLDKAFPDPEKDFCLSMDFHPHFIDATCQAGLYPMSIAIDANRGIYVYAPWISGEKRAILNIGPKMKLPDGVGKHCKRYSIAVNVCWDGVTDLIKAAHGDNWVCPQLREPWHHMMLNPEDFKTDMLCIAVFDNARLVAAKERWESSQKKRESEAEGDDTPGLKDARSLFKEAIVAAELGYVMGDVYTSLSGCKTQSGAGAVQLAMMIALLAKTGYSQWDLGMSMEYKERDLGAATMNRSEWIKNASTHVDQRPAIPRGLRSLENQLLSCGELYREYVALGEGDEQQK